STISRISVGRLATGSPPACGLAEQSSCRNEEAFLAVVRINPSLTNLSNQRSDGVGDISSIHLIDGNTLLHHPNFFVLEIERTDTSKWCGNKVSKEVPVHL